MALRVLQDAREEDRPMSPRIRLLSAFMAPWRHDRLWAAGEWFCWGLFGLGMYMLLVEREPLFILTVVGEPVLALICRAHALASPRSTPRTGHPERTTS